MYLKSWCLFSAAAATYAPVNKHAMVQESVVVSADGVVRLASTQAGFWKTSKADFSALSEQVRSQQDNMDSKISQMITQQQSSGDSCHAQLYRFQNAMNMLHFQLNMTYSRETTLVEEISAQEAIIKDLEDRINKKHAEFEQRLHDCKVQKEEACRQFEMYSAELKELQQLGSSPVTPITLFQNLLKQAGRKGASKQLELLGMHSGASVAASVATRKLVSASRDLQACVARTGQHNIAALQLQQAPEETTAAPTTIEAHEVTGAEQSDRQFADTVTFSAEQCEAERKQLEETWRKSFLIIEDLVEETGATCNDDTCESSVEEERATTMPPLNTERSERIEVVRKAQMELVTEKEKLEDLESALGKLDQTTKQTEETCGEEELGSEYLEAVRSLVRKMRNCPGLSGAVFQIPTFRKMVDIGVKLMSDLDEVTDQMLQKACVDNAVAGEEDKTRAAKQSELDQRVISDLPETNTGDVPILGLCPTCEGAPHAAATSQHKRKCFRPGQGINSTVVSDDCLGNNVMVVCVADVSLEEHSAANTPETTVAP